MRILETLTTALPYLYWPFLIILELTNVSATADIEPSAILDIGAMYSYLSPRMKELGLDDFKDADEYKAQVEYGKLREEALQGSKDELNALPRKERSAVQNKIQQIEDAKKVMNSIDNAVENINADIARIEAEYAVNPTNMEWYRKTYMNVTEVEADPEEIIIGLNKLKEDALNQIDKEIQTNIRYRTRDFRFRRDGRSYEKVTQQDELGPITKVPSGPPIKTIKQNLINDRKLIAQRIAKLDKEISETLPSYKKANEILESKEVYDPDSDRELNFV